MGKITKDKDGDNIYISNSGVEYAMLEGMTYGGQERRSSDIVYFMLDAYDTPALLAHWMYGADFVNELDNLEYITEKIDQFEQDNKDIIQGILNGTIPRLETVV